MGRLLLVRHAESEGNRDGVFTATPDVPLTALGREQARAVADWIGTRHRPRRLVTSPFARACETAAIIGERLGLPPVIEADLRERDYGRLAGQPYSTPRPGYDPGQYWHWRPEGGETLVEVTRRVGAVLDRLAGAAPDDAVVVVSHGAVMMAVHWHVTGNWLPAGRVVRNAGVVLVEHREGAYQALHEIPGDEQGPLG
jgi:broad specificity phosphatase PhoE